MRWANFQKNESEVFGMFISKKEGLRQKSKSNYLDIFPILILSVWHVLGLSFDSAKKNETLNIERKQHERNAKSSGQ